MSSPRNVLIVEDEPLISMMLEDFLDTLGHTIVAAVDSLAQALEAVDKGGFDLAILDVNLKGENVWPVATRLHDCGIPFILATGGHVDPPPPEFRDSPLLEKPYTIERVATVIDEFTASA
ncbi:MAG: response regulator [Sphingomicrobium sp.]